MWFGDDLLLQGDLRPYRRRSEARRLVLIHPIGAVGRAPGGTMTDLDPLQIKYADLPEAVRTFRPGCPGCTPDVATAEDARPCSFYDCPGLPGELRVTCNTCMYDFASEDGQISCDHDTCDTARLLRGNVAIYRRWVEMLREEAAAHG
jgi:hypothetical protein